MILVNISGSDYISPTLYITKNNPPPILASATLLV
ncbi:hypothetical protein EPIR_3356 [Erwinia piriflorinigrans CFBP 5888]|uniref:Uncharacterized protein n=1 Tax=Erwinia piriflorinigrans CFBP 5888 TaxID=1161919 RepID=V5ZCN9_9GAMM|nr:hypothetical protein EPIR_3356 [Erwinia piriflorinigrans CFBP 5888]